MSFIIPSLLDSRVMRQKNVKGRRGIKSGEMREVRRRI